MWGQTTKSHYDKHFDQKSGFNKGNLYFSTENIM